MSLWRIRLTIHPDTQKKILEKKPLILAHWHGDELAVLHLVHRYKLATMTSTSKDGQLIDFVINKFGGATSRGSSTRGAVSALKGLIRLSRAGHILSIAVDGPRGPIYQPKPGVFELSRVCHAEIVPVGVSVQFAHTFHKSWNKTYLPYPFSRVEIHFGETIPVLSTEQNPKDQALAQDLTQRLFVARQQAAKLIAAPGAEC